MTDKLSSLTDLPVDILVLVFPYLDAKSFLALCSTCKALQGASIDPTYWSYATQAAFRVPNQPVVKNDGARWQKMYRRMLTQSHVFTWGSNGNGRLGHSTHDRFQGTQRPPGLRRFAPSSNCSLPTEMDNTRQLGIISDMQCGGWSTTLLTSKGALYTAGVLNGQVVFHVPRQENGGPQPLRFPGGYHSVASAPYHEPTTAIRQFSAGRSHILGLSDSGKIWSWYAVDKPSLQAKFLNVDLNEISTADSSTSLSRYGHVKNVVAGWSRSSAYVYGSGIIVWDPVHRHTEADNSSDTMLVVSEAEIPKTAYQRVKGASRESEEEAALGAEVGAVLNYLILEHYVVFVTDIGRVFCGRFEESNQVEAILELRALRNDAGTPSDVQGSFRSFAIFKNGEVITTNQDYLDACWRSRHDNPDQTDIHGLKRIPVLQQNDVISVAFGDYHFLALHSTGKITSYGTELQACGALGLGGADDPEGSIRGIRYTGFDRTRKLLTHAYTHGRQVWFEPEKQKWITYLTSGGKNPGEAKERMRQFVTEPSAQGEISEWLEQEGRDWDKDPEIKDADEDGLGSYFALSISAAGWHSSALVLVNKKLAERVRQRCIIPDAEDVIEEQEKEGNGSGLSSLFAKSFSWLASTGRAFLGLPSADEQDRPRHGPTSGFLNPTAHGARPEKGYKYIWADKSFPRLRLSDGREMPGEIEFSEWRYGRPDWQLDVDV